MTSEPNTSNQSAAHALADSALEAPEKKAPLGAFFWACVGWLALNVLGAIFAPLLHLQDPNALLSMPGMSFSTSHWLGTDQLGRDIFARIVYGARISLEIGFGSMLIAFLVGGTLGMFAAYRRGKTDMIMSTVMFTFLAFPSIIAVIAVLSFWVPHSTGKIIIVIGVTSIPLVYRVVRSATLSAGAKEYVTAARVQGARDRRIVFRELLPNVAPTGVSFLLFGVATVIALEGVLSFLGLSVPPNVAPSWGNMINEARQAITNTPHNWMMVIFPSLVLCLFILCLNLVGDRLRSHYDVTEVKL